MSMEYGDIFQFEGLYLFGELGDVMFYWFDECLGDVWMGDGEYDIWEFGFRVDVCDRIVEEWCCDCIVQDVMSLQVWEFQWIDEIVFFFFMCKCCGEGVGGIDMVCKELCGDCGFFFQNEIFVGYWVEVGFRVINDDVGLCDGWCFCCRIWILGYVLQ